MGPLTIHTFCFPYKIGNLHTYFSQPASAISIMHFAYRNPKSPQTQLVHSA